MGGAPQPRPRGRRLFWIAGATALVFDLATKYWFFRFASLEAARDHYAETPMIEPALNTGVAWSMFEDTPGLVVLITVLLVPLLIAFYWFGFRPRAGRLENLAFGAVVGGALGNAYDRILAWTGVDPVIGGVRDFVAVHIDVLFIDYHWPTFNVADACLTCGVAALLVHSLFRPRSEAEGSGD